MVVHKYVYMMGMLIPIALVIRLTCDCLRKDEMRRRCQNMLGLFGKASQHKVPDLNLLGERVGGILSRLLALPHGKKLMTLVPVRQDIQIESRDECL